VLFNYFRLSSEEWSTSDLEPIAHLGLSPRLQRRRRQTFDDNRKKEKSHRVSVNNWAGKNPEVYRAAVSRFVMAWRNVVTIIIMTK